MSTKTLRKRIALVAVSALGAGLLSVAPASAAVGLAGTVTSAAPVVVTEPTQKVSQKSSGITVEEFNDQMDISTAQLESVAVMAQTMAMLMAAEEGTN